MWYMESLSKCTPDVPALLRDNAFGHVRKPVIPLTARYSNLPASISQVESLRKKMKQWPPLRSGEQKYKHGLADVMAEEMGWQID